MTVRSVFIHGCEFLRPCTKCGALKDDPCHAQSGNLVYAHMVRQREPALKEEKKHLKNA